MNRSEYCPADESDASPAEAALWRNSVNQAINGKRGQAFLKNLLSDLDAMPEKRLIAEKFLSDSGEMCALGVAYAASAIPLSSKFNPSYKSAARALNIAPALVREIEYINDGDEYDFFHAPTPEERFNSVRAWIIDNLKALNAGLEK